MKTHNDIYEEEVKRLTENPRKIKESWDNEGPLFKTLGKTERDRKVFNCGCLTQIKYFPDWSVYVHGEPDEVLTKLIRADNRIPDSSLDIKPEHLPVFAEWQRKIDKYFETGELS